jgi:hypothetical protein
VLFRSDGFARDSTFILFEGNRSGHAGVNPNNDGADGLSLAAPKNIIRYNSFYNNMNVGILFKYGAAHYPTIGGGDNNKVYNNTFYNNGYGYPGFTFPVRHLTAVGWYIPNLSPSGNVLKNNLAYGSYAITQGGVELEASSVNTFTNNYISGVDPLFVAPTVTDVTSSTLPNLNLQSGSGAINGGASLATAHGAGNASTALILHSGEARYFQDGTWGASIATGLYADSISVGTVGNTVQISSINYATDTITLASPITWADNAPVWLYRKSDGALVLSGTAPDYGAYEYGGGFNYAPFVH